MSYSEESKSFLYIALIILVLSSIIAIFVKHNKETFTDDQLVEESKLLKSQDAPSQTYDTAKHDISESRTMFMFANNKCDPSCCGKSEFSCSSGCVCKTKEQDDMLMQRGYNQSKMYGEIYG